MGMMVTLAGQPSEHNNPLVGKNWYPAVNRPCSMSGRMLARCGSSGGLVRTEWKILNSDSTRSQVRGHLRIFCG